MSEIKEELFSEFRDLTPKTSWRIRTAQRLVAILIATLVVPITGSIFIPNAFAASTFSYSYTAGSGALVGTGTLPSSGTATGGTTVVAASGSTL